MLLVVDAEAEDVAVVLHGGGHIVTWQLRHDAAHHAAGTVRRLLMVGLPEPEDVAVWIADLAATARPLIRDITHFVPIQTL